MNKLIKKIKKLAGITSVEYIIHYSEPLTMSQRTQLLNNMINKFIGTCKPNMITVSTQSVTLRLKNPCLTGDGLKIISDGSLSPSVATIDSITLDGNKIW
jgi:hypothetical protein